MSSDPPKPEHDSSNGIEEPYNIACVVYFFNIFLSDLALHHLTAMSPDYKVQLNPIVLNHLCSISVLLNFLYIDHCLEGIIFVLDFFQPWHRWLFKIFVDWHHFDAKLGMTSIFVVMCYSTSYVFGFPSIINSPPLEKLDILVTDLINQ